MGCVSSLPVTEVGPPSKVPYVEVAKTAQEGDQKNANDKGHNSDSTHATSGTPWTSFNSRGGHGSGPSLPISTKEGPRVDLPWKLSEVELETKRTLTELQELKKLACSKTGITGGRAGLLSSHSLWISTRTGVFTPALALNGTPFGFTADNVAQSRSTEPIIIEDCRQHEGFRDHPAVRTRPNLRFFVGVPLMSQQHCFGLLYLWEAEVREQPPPETVEFIKSLGKQAVKIFQRDMFECLGIETEDANDVTLPTLWLDLSTPRWDILGGNKEWETLSGISIEDMAASGGLLEVMMLRKEEALLESLAIMTERNTDKALPAILTPCAPSGCKLQYVAALKPVSEPFPAGIHASQPTAGADLWQLVVHARVQAVDCPCLKKPAPGELEAILRNILANADVDDDDYDPEYSGHNNDGQGSAPGLNPSNPCSSSSEPSMTGKNSGSVNNGGASTVSGPAFGMSSPRRSVSMGRPRTVTGAEEVLVPPRLASLQLGPLLGNGSYARVYWGTLQDCPVAIKVIIVPPGPDGVQQLGSAQYETIIASDLNHENIVPLIDWCAHSDEQGDVIWMIQELCDGGSLASAIKHGFLKKVCDDDDEMSRRSIKPAVDIRAVLETAIETAKGMQYLHEHDVLHGDLSCNNVLLMTSDNYRGFITKVTDFGLSRALGGVDVATKTIGTISHQPPELLLDGVVGKSGDVFSMGVMLWEMYTGKRAWAGCTHAQVIFAVACRNERLKVPDDAPPAYAALINDCFKESSQRPTFEEIVPRLESMLEGFLR